MEFEAFQSQINNAKLICCFPFGFLEKILKTPRDEKIVEKNKENKQTITSQLSKEKRHIKLYL